MSQTGLEPLDNPVVVAAPVADVSLSSILPASVSTQLTRMFRNPYLLLEAERLMLIEQLQAAVNAEPHVPELRIMLGMALCVNFQAQAALEQLRRAVQLDPNSFIAHLKYGELLMRLRICTRADEETQIAATLAATPLQDELVRRQAASIRTMLREGVERGGFTTPLARISRFFSRHSDGSSQVTLHLR